MMPLACPAGNVAASAAIPKFATYAAASERISESEAALANL
jgi:hypothetical protein